MNKYKLLVGYQIIMQKNKINLFKSYPTNKKSHPALFPNECFVSLKSSVWTNCNFMLFSLRFSKRVNILNHYPNKYSGTDCIKQNFGSSWLLIQGQSCCKNTAVLLCCQTVWPLIDLARTTEEHWYVSDSLTGRFFPRMTFDPCCAWPSKARVGKHHLLSCDLQHAAGLE